MGCASSSPLMESSKHLVATTKDTTNDFVIKSEKTLQEAKDEISLGMEHVKEAMTSEMNTVENCLGTVVENIDNVFQTSSPKELMEEAVKDAMNVVDNKSQSTKDTLSTTANSVTEVVSEAETILISKTENTEKANSSTKSTVYEIIKTTEITKKDSVTDMKNDVEDVIEIEDMEQHFDMLGDNVSNVEKQVEKIVTIIPNPIISTIKDPNKEELPPTFWEAAADAILLQKILHSVDKRDNINKDYKNIYNLESKNQELYVMNEKMDQVNSNETYKCVNHKDLHLVRNID